MLIALASAKGSPGVTTTATALAMTWQRDVVLADLDPAGGDVALRARTPNEDVLDPDVGLLSLAAAARRGLAPEEVPEHLQVIDGGTHVLAGVTRPEQVTGIGAVWTTIGSALRAVPETDVLVDCGRVTPGTPVLPVITAADALVVVVRPSLDSYAHVRDRLRWLSGPMQLEQPGATGASSVGVLVVADPGERTVTQDLDRLLQHEGLPVRVLGRIGRDKRAAEALAGRWSRRLNRSLLMRSAREVRDSIAELSPSDPAAAS
ncbi:MAG TPA: hypothetical protein VK053_17900 [Jiangellaceae bacterium]|nr:hypothetical protein [Jiangellaceae bacterium]